MIFKIFYIIFTFFICTTFCFEYDEKITNTAVNISQSAYCMTNMNNWECMTCEQDNIYESSLLIKGELAIFGYNKMYDSIFVGFRGSTNFHNWFTNIHFSLIYPYDDDIALEKGFYNLFKSMKEDIYNNIDSLTKKYNTKNILITGHSLGGAISTLLSFDILYNSLPYKIYLITFGSPRVGNQKFMKEFNKYNIYSKRITHHYDIVPHVPQEFLDYRHISQEIWYNEDNSNYKICEDFNGEDKYCSNSCAPNKCTSISDHMFYMNISMGSDGYC
jgi:hypothetical protein